MIKNSAHCHPVGDCVCGQPPHPTSLTRNSLVYWESLSVVSSAHPNTGESCMPSLGVADPEFRAYWLTLLLRRLVTWEELLFCNILHRRKLTPWVCCPPDIVRRPGCSPYGSGFHIVYTPIRLGDGYPHGSSHSWDTAR